MYKKICPFITGKITETGTKSVNSPRARTVVLLNIRIF